jgi:hypothetical protein
MHSPDGLKFGSVVDFADVGEHAGPGRHGREHSGMGLGSQHAGKQLELDRHIPWNLCKLQKSERMSCKPEEQIRNQRKNGTGTEQNVQEEYRKQQRRGDNRITEHLQVAHKAIEEAMQETKTRADSAQHEIRSFESIRKEQLNEVSNQWELIRIIVDSGASDTVIPKHLCTSIP